MSDYSLTQRLSKPCPIKKGELIGGQYEVQEVLGRGGAACVYLCYARKLSRQVAAKVMDNRNAKVTEAGIAGGLNHEHIVVVEYAHEPDNPDSDLELTQYPFIVYEYIQGNDLGTYLQEQGTTTGKFYLPFRRDVFDMLRGVAEAIDYVHSLKDPIYHHDIKLSNVIIEEATFKAKLTDFGLAQMITDEQRELIRAEYQNSVFSIRSQVSIEQLMPTITGLRGTPNYLAPEFIMGKVSEDRTLVDNFAFGVLVYQTLTGQFPYNQLGVIGFLANGNAALVSPTKRLPEAEFPPEIDSVLLKALSFEPEERYERCVDFIDALIRVSEAHSEALKDYDEMHAAIKAREWERAAAHYEIVIEALPHKNVDAEGWRINHQIRLLNVYQEACKDYQAGNLESCLQKLEGIKTLLDGEESFDYHSLYKEASYALISKDHQAGRNGNALARWNALIATYEDMNDPDNIVVPIKQGVDHNEQVRIAKDQLRDMVKNFRFQEACGLLVQLEELTGEDIYATNRAGLERYIEWKEIYDHAGQLAEQKQFKQALEELDRAMRLVDTLKSANQEIEKRWEEISEDWYAHAVEYFKAGDYARAVDVWEALKELRPDYPDPENVSDALQLLTEDNRRAAFQASYQRAMDFYNEANYQRAIELLLNLENDYPDLMQENDTSNTLNNAITRLYLEAVSARADNNNERALRLTLFLNQVEGFDDIKQIELNASRALFAEAQGQLRSLKKDERCDAHRKAQLLLETDSRLPGYLAYQEFEQKAKLKCERSGTFERITGALLKAKAPPPKPSPVDTINMKQETSKPPAQKEDQSHRVMENLLAFFRENRNLAIGVVVFLFVLIVVVLWLLLRSLSPPAFVEATHTPTPPLPTQTAIVVEEATVEESQETSEATEVPIVTEAPETTPASGEAGSTVSITSLATLFASPFDDQGDNNIVGYLEPGDAVVIKGRSSSKYGEWLNVETEDGLNGFVARTLTDWNEAWDWDGLPEVDFTSIPSSSGDETVDSSPGDESTDVPSGDPLSFVMFHYNEKGECNGDSWTATLTMQVKGGNGVYTYFINGAKVYGPTTENIVTLPINGAGNNVIINVKVTSDGVEALEYNDYYIPKPGC